MEAKCFLLELMISNGTGSQLIQPMQSEISNTEGSSSHQVVSNHWTGLLEWITGLKFFLVLHILRVGLLYIWVTCDKISVLSDEYCHKSSYDKPNGFN